jgi:cyclic pyranopterin phosphate synthase
MNVEEVIRLVSCFVDLGISKIRFTGGEPLLRHDLCELVEAVSRFPEISDVSLSTNGTLLDRFAVQLKKSGLSRVNISLDTLDRAKFRKITRFGRLESVLSGIEAAVVAGLSPVKLNVVVARGINDNEIEDFARMTETLPVHVRFIELMPMGESGFFSRKRWIPLGDIIEKASPIRQLSESDWPPGYGPARYFERQNSKGTIGFIGALSDRFCFSCNRVRLSSKGILIPCLDVFEGTDLRTSLREGASRKEIKALILRAIERKPEGHNMMERISGLSAHSPLMCRIGG